MFCSFELAGGATAGNPAAASGSRAVARHSIRTAVATRTTTGAGRFATTLDAYSDAVLASGPAAYYRLNDTGTTALDSSPNGLNGTIGTGIGKGAASLIASTAATALRFPGTKAAAGVVLVPATAKLTPATAVSMETFLQFTSTPVNFTVPVSYGTDANYAPYDLYFTSGGVLNAQFYLTSGVLVVTTPSALAPSTNYDIVATFDGTTARLYVNGAQVASKAKSGSLTSYDSSHGLAIGDDAGYSDPAFAGTLQAVAIYAKTLAASDVTAHYNASRSGSPPPTPTPTPTPVPTSAPGGSVDWLTYHANSLRTGWNASETVLNTTTVTASTFGLLASLPVDGQVYTEPLIVTKETVPGIGVHDLLVVGTENDSVYAFDAQTGATIWKRTFLNSAAHVAPVSALDAGCHNVSPSIGITSTPVIDRAKGRIYVVAATDEGAGTFVTHIRLHAISVLNGSEIASSDIGGSYPQTGGGTIVFQPKWQMSRASLLENDGNVYVAFGSHCDNGGQAAHGWLFGYDANTLAPAGSDFLTTADPETKGLTLGSIWGSGMGPSADASGNVYAATGNGGLYDGAHSYTQSVLELSPGLGFPVISSFTPSTQATENAKDQDLGSGGVVLLPDQAGTVPHVAIASGKTGISYLLNRDSLGGYTPTAPDNIPFEAHTNNGLWGAPAYFVGADGHGYIAICGGNDPMITYRVNTSPLTLSGGTKATARINSEEGGTIPVVSSNGTKAGTAIVWATSRPADTTTPIVLYAYDAANLAHQLFAGSMQPWNNTNGDVLITPTVANGKVYVGTANAVNIFGLK